MDEVTKMRLEETTAHGVVKPQRQRRQNHLFSPRNRDVRVAKFIKYFNKYDEDIYENK